MHYKTLLWLTSRLTLLNDDSFSSSKCSLPAKNKLEKTYNNLSEKDQFQLITSRIINISSFKNRRKRLSLCETDIKAFTQDDACMNSQEYDKAEKIFSTSQPKKVLQAFMVVDIQCSPLYLLFCMSILCQFHYKCSKHMLF